MSKVTGTTLTPEGAASSSLSENASAERKVRANKVTGSTSSIITDRSTLPRDPFSLQELMEKNNGSNVSPSLHA